jgi:hypothetical protein
MHLLANRFVAPAAAAIAACVAVPSLANDGAAGANAQRPDFNGIWVSDEMSFLNPQRGPDGSILCIVGCPPPPSAAKPAAAGGSEAKAEGDAEAKPAARPARRAPDRPKYKPEFQAKVKDLDTRQVEMDPALRCRNPGLPRIGPPDAIMQNKTHVVFLYNDLNGAFWRMIPTDGRPHRADAEETYLGDAIGRFDGDTLIVESVKFIDDTWLTDDGSFHSPSLKVTERLKLNGEKLEYQAIADDPEVLAEPWHLRARTLKRGDKPMNEPLPCIEQDLDHIVDGTHHDNAR